MGHKSILYLSTYPFENKGAFSGTNRRIFDALNEIEEYRFDYYLARPNPIIKFYFRLVGFIYRFWIGRSLQTGLEELYYKSICRRTKKHLKRTHYEAIIAWQLCFGDVFVAFGGKKVFFADSTYHALVPYYRWDVTKKQFASVDESQRKLLSFCDQFWCFSSYFISDAMAYYGLDRGKIKQFRFFPTIDAPKTKTPKRSDIIRFLLVGTNYQNKGVPIAIEALKILREVYKLNVHLDVVGVDAIGNEDNRLVTFHGRVSQFSDPDRFGSFFSNADIYFMPTNHECAGIVFAEAAFCGLPVVSYRTGGVPDYVSDGVSGFLLPENATPYDFADLIAKKLASSEQRGRMSKSARAFFDQYLTKNVFVREAKLNLKELFDNI